MIFFKRIRENNIHPDCIVLCFQLHMSSELYLDKANYKYNVGHIGNNIPTNSRLTPPAIRLIFVFILSDLPIVFGT